MILFMIFLGLINVKETACILNILEYLMKITLNEKR